MLFIPIKLIIYLIYTTKEFEFKHCPVTFNFLSNEFVFENQLFKSINDYLSAISSWVEDMEGYYENCNTGF